MTNFLRISVWSLPTLLTLIFTGNAMASDNASFFQLLDTLLENRNQPPQTLEELLGVTFGSPDPRSTELATLYQSTASSKYPALASALFRAPAPGSQVKRMVGLNLNENITCIALVEVEEHAGQDYTLDVPYPEQPSSAPLFLTYGKAWGSLKFGVSRQGAKCLKTVFIESD